MLKSYLIVSRRKCCFVMFTGNLMTPSPPPKMSSDIGQGHEVFCDTQLVFHIRIMFLLT